MPMLSERIFKLNKRLYVQPLIKNIYHEHQTEMQALAAGEPLMVALDGQFDSPGYCSELCRVTALDVNTNLVVTFAVSHKAEVGGVSNRMELHGVKKVLKALEEKGIPIGSVTIDKNLSVMKYLRESGIVYHFDLWHLLKHLCKDIRAYVKKLTAEEEQKLMRSLQRRLFTHIWGQRELAEEDTARFKDLVLCFFPHIIGTHEWPLPSKLTDLVAISAGTRTTKGLRQLSFTVVDRCQHGELDEAATPPIDADSIPLQKLVELLTKTAFLTDLDRVNCASATSAVESLHSLLLRYCPKRQYYSKTGYELKAMLGVLDWNTTQMAELEGVRKTVGLYRSYSKARGEERTITRKATVEQPWKRELVERSIERKRQCGPGTPDLDDEELEGEIDDLADRLIKELLIDDEDDEEGDESGDDEASED
jgi:phosphoglycolate phosphatase-like HAD superfamily hydrolase